VAIVDIRMPPTFTDEGLRATLNLRQRHEGLGILMFSQYIETRYAADLLADEAAGISSLLKDPVANVSDSRPSSEWRLGVAPLIQRSSTNSSARPGMGTRSQC